MALDFTIKSLTKDKYYGFRYRAKNEYGWGDYSPVAQLLVATEPGKPSVPTFVESSETELTIKLAIDSIENNGSDILEYSLEISDDKETFIVVNTYSTNS